MSLFFGDENKEAFFSLMNKSSISDYLTLYENEKIVLILDKF